LQTLTTLKKPVRMLSGVSVVAVMAKPWPCPHGKCLYCFGGPPFTPQSYYGKEPALMRAAQCDYDPYEQVRLRLTQYTRLGHTPSKVDLIIMGGTFPSMPLDYQEWFITMCLEAMNRFPKPRRNGTINLGEAQKRNEKAKIRCVGMTFETRPDWAKEQHVDFMLKLGATKVELGVQTVYDDILKGVKRGHTVKDSIIATRILKDAGLKVTYHLMPGLPGSTPELDFEAFKTVFEDPDFRPDGLKIYPTLVLPGSELYELWKKAEYKALEVDEVIDLLCRVKPLIPKWIRVMRVQRDVPAQLISAGVRKSNLRELVLEELKRRGLKCRCIRCREVGIAMLKRGITAKPENVKLLVEKYEASMGIEVFVSFEDVIQDLLIGFARLRIPSQLAHRPEVGRKAALLRELKVCGPQIPVGVRTVEGWQHKGFGARLLNEVERIAKEEYDLRLLLVTSGIGAKPYYRAFGYRKYPNSPYMYKRLR